MLGYPSLTRIWMLTRALHPEKLSERRKKAQCRVVAYTTMSEGAQDLLVLVASLEDRFK